MLLLVATAIICLLCVGIHYEILWLTSKAAPKLPGPRRLRVAFGILASVVAHIVEILLFAVGWAFLIEVGLAELTLPNPTMSDLIYFSGTIYTSLGFGDIVPVGNARNLAFVEAVLGLVLIAWTASFSYFEMSENWPRRLR